MNKIESIQAKKRTLFLQRIGVFALTFLAFSSTEATRACWSFSQNNFSKDTGISKHTIGYFNMIFLFCYAFSLYVIGQLGDRFNLKYFVGCGMLLTSVIYGSQAFVRLVLHCKNPYVYAIIIGLNGMSQGSVWPGIVGVMSNWYGKGNRGLLMGVWSGNSNIGDVIGFQIIGEITITLQSIPGTPWANCIIGATVYNIIVAFCFLLFLNPYPKKLGLDVEYLDSVATNNNQTNSELNSNNNQITSVQDSNGINQTSNSELPSENIQENQNLLQHQNQSQPPQQITQINFFTAWLVPGVAIYVVAYTCVKSTAFGLLFWLPTFISDQHLDKYNASITSQFDYGSYIGSILTGYITDRLGKRCIYMVPALWVAAVLSFVVYWSLATDPLPYYFVIFFIGIFLGGPYQIISAACCIDLAKQPVLAGNSKAVSTISGILEGVGSFGSAILQVILGRVSQIFPIFMALCFLGGLVLVPYAIRDLKELKKSKKQNQNP
eukprot:TRINITY_DN3213_c0_g6_i1.p1 TRINITY_DN3213_c0_g6~~TRINITY_DN3213_c0_g6_i1.p1  ORF type:complete len:492 (-),score=37.74 TRINITY_DN3213_c0_g6_i1:328-1803(-)